jgi:hypothetical protein
MAGGPSITARTTPPTAYPSAVCAALTVSHRIETRTITAAFSPIGLRKAIEAITRANLAAH